MAAYKTSPHVFKMPVLMCLVRRTAFQNLLVEEEGIIAKADFARAAEAQHRQLQHHQR